MNILHVSPTQFPPSWEEASKKIMSHSFNKDNSAFKVRPCPQILKSISCHAGVRCYYAHSPSELTITKFRKRHFKQFPCSTSSAKKCFGSCSYIHPNQTIIYPNKMADDSLGRIYDDKQRLISVFVFEEEEVVPQFRSSNLSPCQQPTNEQMSNIAAASTVSYLPQPQLMQQKIPAEDQQHSIATLTSRIQEQQYQIQQEQKYQAELGKYQRMQDKEKDLVIRIQNLQQEIQKMQQKGWQPPRWIEQEKTLQEELKLHRNSLQQQQEILLL